MGYMRNNLFILFIILSALLSTTTIQGQNRQFNPDKLIFGGDIGFGISSGYWNVGLSPQVGYKLTEKFHVGAGITYIYGQSRDNTYSKQTDNSIGLNLFAHYYPWKKLVLRVKPEIMLTRYNVKYYIESETDSYWQKYSANKFVPAVVVGGGFHFKPVMILLNYELIQNKYSSYSDGVFLSLGVMF